MKPGVKPGAQPAEQIKLGRTHRRVQKIIGGPVKMANLQELAHNHHGRGVATQDMALETTLDPPGLVTLARRCGHGGDGRRAMGYRAACWLGPVERLRVKIGRASCRERV